MGRRKLGNVLYAKRVPPELVGKMDAYLSAAIEARKKGNLEAIEKWHLETYGVSATLPVYENKGFTEENLKALEPHCEKVLREAAPSVVARLEARIKELEKKVKDYEQTYG